MQQSGTALLFCFFFKFVVRGGWGWDLAVTSGHMYAIDLPGFE
jgi:hypothetical protein